jgi:histidyl-tRNA synthetase
LGFEKFTIYINNRKILNGIFAELNLTDVSTDIMRIIDKIDKIGKEAVIGELEKLNINSAAINTIIDFILIKGTTDEKIAALKQTKINNELFNSGLMELEEVIKGVRLFGVPEEYFTVDFKIARGLDYYTGTVYETFLNDYRNIGSICSGGRYDNLSTAYTDKKMPGVGVSIGFTRLFYILNEMQLIKADKKSISDVLIISMDKNIDMCLETAGILRNSGVKTEVYLEDKKIKVKMKYADKLKIPYVIIIGEEEIKTGLLSLKNMETGEQQSLTMENLLLFFNNI